MCVCIYVYIIIILIVYMHLHGVVKGLLSIWNIQTPGMSTLLVLDIFEVLGIEIKLPVGLKAAFIPACTGTVLESLFSGDNPSA